MKKKGPCCHCGIDSTPLWRNGPPEKPVLCNACGSRYRLGKPLENYTPKSVHAIRKKKRKANLKAIYQAEENINITSNACYSSVLEHYASAESSTSHNHNCIQIKQDNEGDSLYPVENWGSFCCPLGPSRRRSPVVYNNLTTIQKLQRDLHNILKEEGPLNEFEGPDEDHMLIDNINVNKLQIPSPEIGLGSILLKFPVTNTQEQEIEPCSSNVCAKAFDLNAPPPMASPSLPNACSDDVDVGQNENSPIVLDDDCASPTMGAADG